MKSTSSFPHLPQLDGIRAIAVALVFLAHLGFERLVPGGFGVTIFFFLSGYLITSLLVSEHRQTGRIGLADFYVRRTLRIWPPLWITMAFCALVVALGWIVFDVDGWGVVAQLAFVVNYASLWGHPEGLPYLVLWSLAVEEHFYLVFPLVFVVFLARMPPRSAAIACAAACAAVLAIRIATVASLPDFSGVYFWSHTRVDSILFGCCLALWKNPALDPDPWRFDLRHFAAALALLVACFLFRGEVFRQTLRYTLQGIALYVVFSYVLRDQGVIRRLLSTRPMRIVGLYSYTLYLVHFIVIALIEINLRQLPFAIRVVLAVVLSFGYAHAMYVLVERPMARLRKAFHRVDAGATVASTR